MAVWRIRRADDFDVLFATFCYSGLFSPLFALGIAADIDATGLSTSMNIIWHAAAVRCVPERTSARLPQAISC